MRELWEETGVRSADYLGETDWLAYDSRRLTDRSRTGSRNSRPAPEMVRAALYRR